MNPEFAALMGRLARRAPRARTPIPSGGPSARGVVGRQAGFGVPAGTPTTIVESDRASRAASAAARSTSPPSVAQTPFDALLDLALDEPDLALRVRVRARQRRHRRRRRAARRGALHARPLRRRRPRRPAVRRAAGHRLPRQLGARPQPDADRDGGAQAHRRAGRHPRPAPTAATSAPAAWADVVRVRPRHRRARARCAGCATSRPTPSASPPTSRPACATSSSTARPCRSTANGWRAQRPPARSCGRRRGARDRAQLTTSGPTNGPTRGPDHEREGGAAECVQRCSKRPRAARDRRHRSKIDDPGPRVRTGARCRTAASATPTSPSRRRHRHADRARPRGGGRGRRRRGGCHDPRTR